MTTENNFNVRAATQADAAALVPLLAQLGYAGAEAFVERRVAEQLDHPDALLLVAEVEGAVRGFMSLHFIPQLALPGDFCRLSYLCVDQAARSLGIGAALERRAVEEARRRGCDRIELHSHERRRDAHRFYFREGYEESPKYLMKKLPR
jgi:GNAT superfamily N-acetyltransferase